MMMGQTFCAVSMRTFGMSKNGPKIDRKVRRKEGRKEGRDKERKMYR